MKAKDTQKLLLLVACHKPYHTLRKSKKLYDPIQVGKENSTIDLGILSDNGGADNICTKNQNYSELTALYYAWKNTNYEYYGLMHYRRYFKQCHDLKFFGKTIAKCISKKLIKKEKYIQLLADYDLILPTPWYFNDTVYDAYTIDHCQQDLDLVGSIIKDKYADFLPFFESVMSESKMYGANMFITNKVFFNEYMTWLFGIFDELETVITISDDPYQRRVFGFLSERMFLVFINYKIHYSNIKIKEIPVVYIKDSFIQRIPRIGGRIRRIIAGYRARAEFKKI